MNSHASQSSRSWFLGGSPWAPKSSSDFAMPPPKNCFHKRFIVTRAVNGLSLETSHSARSRRVRRGLSNFVQDALRYPAKAGWTASPLSSRKFPRGKIRTVRAFSSATETRQCGNAVSKSVLAFRAISNCFRNSANSEAVFLNAAHN